MLVLKGNNGYSDRATLIRRGEERTSYSLLFLNKKRSWSRAPGSRQETVYIYRQVAYIWEDST